MDNLNKKELDVKEKINFASFSMPIGVMIIFLLMKLIGWFTEALSFYFTQLFFINSFPGSPLASSLLGAVSDISKLLGFVFLFLYPIKHSWQYAEIGWNLNVYFAWFERFINSILSFIKTIIVFVKKESHRWLVHLLIAQGVFLSCIATHSALTIKSYESNKTSSEYISVQGEISGKQELIGSLRSQNKLKEQEIRSNNDRINGAGDELSQTRYKGLVYRNEAAYRERNQQLSNEISENNDKIAALMGEISGLNKSATQIEKSDVSYGNVFFKKIKDISGGGSIDFAILIFALGLEIIGGYYFARWVIENQDRILEWFVHSKNQKKVGDSIRFMQKKQSDREKFLLAIKHIYERGNFNVTPEMIAAVIKSDDYGFFKDKMNPGHVLTEQEIREIEGKITKSLPSPSKKLPGGITEESLNSLTVNGRLLTDPEKLELSEAMANLPGVYGDDTPEFQRLKKLIDGWKTGNVQEKRYGFLPENDGEPNTPERPTEHSAEHPENERSPGVRRTTPNTLPNTLPNTKNEQFGEQFTEHRTPDIEQPPNSKNSGGKSSEEAEKIIIEVAQKNPTASVRKIGKIAGELAFQRKIKKNSNPYSPGTVQPIIKKKVQK